MLENITNKIALISDFKESFKLQTYNLFFIFLYLASYFGGIQPIVVVVDKICRQDTEIEISRNLLVVAPSKSYVSSSVNIFSILIFYDDPQQI